MKIAVFLNGLGLGGTEKAAVVWGAALKKSGQDVRVIALEDGPRRADFEESGIPVTVISADQGDCPACIADELKDVAVIHAHAPGFAHKGDILGATLKITGRKIPVVQTNIFGQLQNPVENEWTDFRLFISWTSCVQAAQRSGKKLDLAFFRRQSVAVYPVEDPFDKTSRNKLCDEAETFRQGLGLAPANVLFGRFSRPEPNKWSPLALEAFFKAHRQNPNIRLLLQEPPSAVAQNLPATGKAFWGGDAQLSNALPIALTRVTRDPHRLSIAQMACDAILHTSSIGESFGYGIAEAMALGKPVIANSVPWNDQAQIELVRHGECGVISSTIPSIEAAILLTAESGDWRAARGANARRHILALADPRRSEDRIETAMRCAVENRDNPAAEEDVERARVAVDYLRKHQWGHSFEESLWLRQQDAGVRFLQWQRKMRDRLQVRFAGEELN